MSYPVKICVVGAGSRGSGYVQYAKAYPEQAVVTAVAEPRDFYRQQMAKEYNIDEKNQFKDWQELASAERLADAVLICTHDNLHVEPALALIEKGYDILLEKPMAPTKQECKQIVDAATKKGVIFSVCHVLRYTEYTQTLKKLLDSGVIGDIVSIQHLEPIGYWHFAHSYVRGNWRNEKESSCILLAKSCHDLDWLRYIAGSRCAKISSFGNLFHFKAENKPKGASDRCTDCAVESRCPYSAKRFYLKRAEQGRFTWPLDVLTKDLTIEGIQKALEEGPYGRCVYACDNDVVDHQVVNMEFESGVSAVFTMTAFNEQSDRKTAIFGTKGQVYGDGSQIRHYDFLTEETKIIDLDESDGSILTGHGGGDYEIMKAFIKAVKEQDQSCVLSGPVESLETHLSVFAAEESRKAGEIINF